MDAFLRDFLHVPAIPEKESMPRRQSVDRLLDGLNHGSILGQRRYRCLLPFFQKRPSPGRDQVFRQRRLAAVAGTNKKATALAVAQSFF